MKTDRRRGTVVGVAASAWGVGAAAAAAEEESYCALSRSGFLISDDVNGEGTG